MFSKIRHSLFVLGALLGLLTGCSMMSPPENLDLRLSKASAASAYSVTVRPLVEPVEINKIHSWELQVANASGDPVKGAKISVDGGMPQHGHGLPTKPRVTAELADGRYRVDGVKFSMTGWWELKFKIDADKGSDQITFNLVLPQASDKLSAR
ncbi:FixH family protein [Pseudoduganella sp. RAF53_2]|uniref:FixH family protein n=1 Tax=unclassified Pseudoduganella TaxID=2637179 RepID=UPI003F9DBB6D